MWFTFFRYKGKSKMFNSGNIVLRQLLVLLPSKFLTKNPATLVTFRMNVLSQTMKPNNI